MQPALLFGTLLGAGAMLVWRVRETRSPVTAPKILIPPLGMATGLAMFAYPPTRVPLAWALAAFAIGALALSPVLVCTSRLVREGDAVVLQRSKAFLAILLGLVAVRLAARAWIERYVDHFQTGALLFLLAFGTVVVWRARMYFEYRRVQRTG